MAGIKKVEKYPVFKCARRGCSKEIVSKLENKGQRYCSPKCWALAHGISEGDYEESICRDKKRKKDK